MTAVFFTRSRQIVPILVLGHGSPPLYSGSRSLTDLTALAPPPSLASLRDREQCLHGPICRQRLCRSLSSQLAKLILSSVNLVIFFCLTLLLPNRNTNSLVLDFNRHPTDVTSGCDENCRFLTNIFLRSRSSHPSRNTKRIIFSKSRVRAESAGRFLCECFADHGFLSRPVRTARQTCDTDVPLPWRSAPWSRPPPLRTAHFFLLCVRPSRPPLEP